MQPPTRGSKECIVQACTTAGKQPKNPPNNPLDKKCNGGKRMFQWNNSYFQDVTSGKCEPRKVSPENAEWYPTSDENAKGRAPNAKEDKVSSLLRLSVCERLLVPQGSIGGACGCLRASAGVWVTHSLCQVHLAAVFIC